MPGRESGSPCLVGQLVPESFVPESSHLHLSAFLSDGRVLVGHAACGCTVRTTAEVLVAVPPQWRFSREHDVRTGHDELVVRSGSG